MHGAARGPPRAGGLPRSCRAGRQLLPPGELWVRGLRAGPPPRPGRGKGHRLCEAGGASSGGPAER